MSRRAPRLTARAWLGAAAGSMTIHALAVLALVQGGDRIAPMPDRPSGMPSMEAEWIDVLPLADAALADVQPAKTLADERVIREAPEGSQDHDPAEVVAPRIAEGRDRRAPAADKGSRAGRVTDDVAWRRDRSTLHARLTDGASLSQPPRLDRAARPASPQAVRREPIVGVGDSVQTQSPASVPSPPQYASPDESPAGDSSRSAPGVRTDRPVVAELEFPRRADTAASVRGVGPLNAELGPRSFDSETRGIAGDNRDQRAASREPRPGITDFSRAGVRGREDTLTGRGPGDAPGAVDHPSPGRGPSVYGGASAPAVGDEVSEATQDRRYQLYILEIARRVNSAREFPKRLALRLEQGETVVRFVLESDGRIQSGVRVMKSSGFDEFDSAAARAVERAAPFPPMPRALSARSLTVSVRVAFENPLVR